MDLDESQTPKGLFECQLCRLSVPYTYFGQKPPNTKSIMFTLRNFQLGFRNEILLHSAHHWRICRQPNSAAKIMSVLILQADLCTEDIGVYWDWFTQRTRNLWKEYWENHRKLQNLLEECFVMRDPFVPDKEKFLILGSPCSLCKQVVCVSPECSLFYSKRFCLPCVTKNKDAFPPEIQQDLEKRKTQDK